MANNPQAVKDLIASILASKGMKLQEILERLLDPQAIEAEINQKVSEQIKAGIIELARQNEGPLADLATLFYDNIGADEVLEAISPSLTEKIYEWLIGESKTDFLEALAEKVAETLDEDILYENVASQLTKKFQIKPE